MKNCYLIVSLFQIVISFSLNGQEANTRLINATTKPFKTDVFIENYGQFDCWANSNSVIKYAVNNGDNIFFTEKGLVYKIVKNETPIETSIEENEKEIKKPDIYYVYMEWEGLNINSKIIADEETKSYYTFGEKGYEDIKAKGYKKLLYKEIYPGIDVEYTIPEKGGIKYKLMLQAGANPDLIKMKYSGDVEKISIDNNGNAIIKTPAGDIVDHAPQSFYERNNNNILSEFEIKENIISFKLPKNITIQQAVVIDPWTTTPPTLFENSAAFDIDVDNFGNVFVAGGGASFSPFHLAKYSSSGNLLWTFTNPTDWSIDEYSYSKFCRICYRTVWCFCKTKHQ